MKDNKKTIYILLPLVIIIWGFFAYKLYQMIAGDKDELIVSPHLATKKQPDLFIKDTFSIVANYRDPFLGKIIAENLPKAPVSNIPVKPKEPEKKSLPWPSVVYYGLVKKKNEDKQLISLAINNKEYLLKNGAQTTEGITILKVYRDSVEVSYGKEKKMIKK